MLVKIKTLKEIFSNEDIFITEHMKEYCGHFLKVFPINEGYKSIEPDAVWLPEWIVIDEEYKNLQHHYDSTIGLWCIDRKPDEVDYEWIKKNSFQLTEAK